MNANSPKPRLPRPPVVLQLLMLVSLAALPTLWAALQLPGEKQPFFSEPPLEEGEERLREVLTWEPDSYQWVDARTRGQFAEDHIPGAVNLNMDDWDELFFANMEAIASAERLVIYCDGLSCRASHEVRDKLAADGINKNALVLKGGWPEWLQYRRGGQETQPASAVELVK
jgi:rhodanese-related sulfurtransferase